ncbi:MAG: amidohydrolase family protein [Candidatus Fermentibacteria bacterium]
MSSILCGGLWSGPERGVLPPSRVSITGDRITDISPSADIHSNLFVIPGFVDAHCHFCWSGLQSLYLDLSETVSSSDLLDMASSADSEGTGRILRGFGFDESNWKNPMLPSLAELDRATGPRPVFFRRVCCHEALVNSAMLEMLPPNCPGADYGAGIIREGAVFDLESMFPPEPHILKQACSMAAELAFSSGVTALCTFEPLVTAEVLIKNAPPVRMSICLFGKDAGFPGEARGSLESVLQGIDGLKFFLDGSIGASTAAVSGKYIDGTAAEPLLSDEEVLLSLELADSLGLMPVYHAIGGKALAQIDRVSRYFCKEHERKNPAPVRIEHAEELVADWPGSWNPSLHTFVMQPNFVNRWQGREGLYEGKLGKERAAALNPFRLVTDAGFTLAFGSDSMPFGPLRGIAGSTDHPLDEFGIDIASALNAYTLKAAAVCGFNELAGDLAAGRIADMTVLSADPFHTSWDEIEVVATITGGKTVFGQELILEDI